MTKSATAIQEILDRLGGGHPQGKGYVAHCPVHQDRNPSLSLREENGKVLLKCQAGCATESILAALGMKWSDLFAGRSPDARPKTSEARVNIEAEYNYVDETNTLLYQVLRLKPKGFRQRRPNGKGWIWNLDGIRRVLYRLPEVLSSDSVHICEGERDCNNAFELGLVATCNPGGAGKWMDDYSSFLRGKSIVIIQDADEPGRKHGQMIAASLQGSVESLKVLELPNAKDLSDWLAQGGTSEALLKLIETAPQWESPHFEGGATLDLCMAFIRRFVRLSHSQIRVVTLWVAHTFAFEAADATPYLNINSPAKRSGKTRLLEVIETVASKPWMTGRATTAVLPRKIDQEQPTLLLDESDSAFSGDPGYAQSLRNVLNNGHRRGGKVSCCVGNGTNYVARDFSVFCPKAIAGIGSLPDTVADRSIPIRLKRKIAGEPLERFRLRDVETEATILRDRLAAWSGPIVKMLRNARPQLPVELTDRQQDGAEPLLAIADAAGGEWPEAARLALIELCSEAQSLDESFGVRLLADIRQTFGELGSDRISSADLVKALAEIETSPWSEYSAGKQLTAVKLARLLGPFGVVPHSVRIGDKTPRGYQREDLEDAWQRYLPAPNIFNVSPATSRNATVQQPNTGAGFSENSKRNMIVGVADQECEKPNQNSGCCTVAPPGPSSETTEAEDEDEL